MYDDPANSTATYTVLQVYICPSEPRQTYWNLYPGDQFYRRRCRFAACTVREG